VCAVVVFAEQFFGINPELLGLRKRRPVRDRFAPAIYASPKTGRCAGLGLGQGLPSDSAVPDADDARSHTLAFLVELHRVPVTHV